MDECRPSISPQGPYSRLGTAAAPLVIDVRLSDAFEADDAMIVGPIRRRWQAVEVWRKPLPAELTLMKPTDVKKITEKLD